MRPGEAVLDGEAARRALGMLPYSTLRIVDVNAPLVDAAAAERRAAAAALGRLGTKEALKGLIAALGDGTLSVAAAALAPLKVRAEEKGETCLARELEIELESGRRLDGMKLMEAQCALEKLFGLE